VVSTVVKPINKILQHHISKFLLEEVLGRVWRGRVLSRQSINEVLKKHNRNGPPYRKNRRIGIF